MNQDRRERQNRWFLDEGRRSLQAANVTIVGVGGLGSHLVQQLAFLGVGSMTVIDKDMPDITSLNRLIGARHNDHLSGLTKVDIAARSARDIDPTINVTALNQDLISAASFDAVKNADFVFGCVDNDGPRLVLTELCAAYGRPYFDLAAEIKPGADLHYGGRVCFSEGGHGCLMCLEEISPSEVNNYLSSNEAKLERKSVYGLPADGLEDSGPAVVTLNGVITSLAATEFMVHVTGIRRATRFIVYHGNISKVMVSLDQPSQDCYYCKVTYGSGAAAEVERYLHRL